MPQLRTTTEERKAQWMRVCSSLRPNTFMLTLYNLPAACTTRLDCSMAGALSRSFHLYTAPLPFVAFKVYTACEAAPHTVKHHEGCFPPSANVTGAYAAGC